MNCEETHERLVAIKNGDLGELERQQMTTHLQSCKECRFAAQGFNALQHVRARQSSPPPDELFDRLMRRTFRAPKRQPVANRFWLGAGFGGALAASLMAAVMMSGLLTETPLGVTEPPQFQVALGEPRDFNVAIELERDLHDATITVVLAGGIELDGYAGRRELSWTADLQAGVNKLTLPIVAINETGGQLLVKVDHENRQRRFTVDLDLAS